MSLINKDHLSLTIQALKKLIDRIEARFLTEDDAIKMSVKTGLVKIVAEDNGVVYTDESGAIYTL